MVGLARISQKELDLRRTEIAGIELDVLPPIHADISKCLLQKFTDRVCLTRPQNITRRTPRLQNTPHTLHVFRSVSPVAASIQIAQIELGLFAGLNSGHGAGDLASDKGLSS